MSLVAETETQSESILRIRIQVRKVRNRISSNISDQGSIRLNRKQGQPALKTAIESYAERQIGRNNKERPKKAETRESKKSVLMQEDDIINEGFCMLLHLL